ncbi:MAG: histidinol phosphatase [Nitriliruptoraceae bacterium]|nr:histidinol phosphatase [Nitriliruptoraceae bacterium]
MNGPDDQLAQAMVWRDAALEFADAADALALGAFRRALQVRTKDDGTWVTDVDVGIERAIRRRIQDRFPEHAILGEEDGRTGPRDAPTWVIDPIDGTTNFVKGNPIFATLIAVRVGDDDRVGVVSAPALGTRFDGVVGAGARQDGRSIAVSMVDDLARAEVALGGLDVFAAEQRMALVDALAHRAARIRGYGDFWQHCLVAAGSTDVALEAEVKLWDLAAVRALVEAAGGRFTDLVGRATADGGSAIASNGHLHDDVLALVEATATPPA